ncbi:MAG: thiolase family protein [Acidimicrobiales bacterium]
MAHPYHDVAIVGIHNTAQAIELEGHDAESIALVGALGALADAAIEVAEVDGVVGQFAQETVLELGLGPCSRRPNMLGIPAVLEAASMICSGECDVVLISAGGARLHRERSHTAPWTRPANELVVGYGLFTAAEFALMARRHMITFGTTAEHLATVAATIRNNGHDNPEAVYSGRGPFTPQDILASRVVADPFHLLDCAMTSEGGCGIVLARADRAAGCAHRTWMLGAASDSFGPAYTVAPVWDYTPRDGGDNAGNVGARAARTAFRTAGLSPDDVDVCELYDPFSFEIIRQLEAFGFCAEGEGGPFVAEGNITADGKLPVTTDGGTMSFSHAGIAAQQLQRVIRGVEQLRGTTKSHQVEHAEVAMCSNGGSGALFTDVLLLGSDQP